MHDKTDTFFSKLDTKIIKGLAIILMLMHHLWAFPNRIAGGQLKYLFKVNELSSLVFFGKFGNICISIFFFVGGYGIYKLSEKNNFNIFNNIKKLFINYWKVFFIFIPIGFIFFNNQIAYCENISIYSRFSNFDKYDLIKNFLGFSHSLNSEWWFLHSYLIAIISFTFIKKLFNNKSTIFNIFIIIIYTLLVSNVFPSIGKIESLGLLNNNILYNDFFLQPAPYISCFWLGILFSKDDLLLKLKNKINEVFKLNIFFDIIGIFTIIYIRQLILGEIYDMIYIPFLIIFFLDIVKKYKLLTKGFELLGIHSTNIWLIHTFLCYYFYFFVKIVVYFKWSIPCLLVLIILSLLASYGVNYLWKLINKLTLVLKNKILRWL
ncbi:MAG: acyltransferase family protein [Bacilli bacterium]|nr:acyltransferase family protein [Bacilli bacterium]